MADYIVGVLTKDRPDLARLKGVKPVGPCSICQNEVILSATGRDRMASIPGCRVICLACMAANDPAPDNVHVPSTPAQTSELITLRAELRANRERN